MNALSEVLQAVKLTGAVFLDAEFRAPWCIAAQGKMAKLLMPDAEHFIHYHYIVDGRCRARVEGARRGPARGRRRRRVPARRPARHGERLCTWRHSRLAEHPRPAEPRRSRGRPSRRGRRGDADHLRISRLRPASLQADPFGAAPLFSVSIRSGPSGEWLESSLRHSVAEAASTRAGADVVLARLSEVLFVETLRRYIESLHPDRRAGSRASATRSSATRSNCSTASRRALGRWTNSPARPVARAPFSPNGSRSISVSRRSSTLRAGGSPWPRAGCDRVARASRASPTRSATNPKRRSTARSSASSVCRPHGGDATTAPRRRTRPDERRRPLARSCSCAR